MDTKANSTQASIEELTATLTIITSEYEAANADRLDFAERITSLNAALLGRQEEIGRLMCRVGEVEAARPDLAKLAVYSREMRGGQHGRIGFEDFYAAADIEALFSGIPSQASAEPVALLDQFGNVFPLGAYSPAGKPNYHDAHKRGWKSLYTRPATQAASQPVAAVDVGEAIHKCWSCKKPYTLSQRSYADGQCPHCDVEIELDDEDATPAPASDSADGFLPLPKSDTYAIDPRGLDKQVYSATDMRAAILADRAARQVPAAPNCAGSAK
ncbi:MAG: hypothetical protein WA191_07155 [Telluria sp.]